MYGFGNRLKHLRKKKGFSQKALAQRICKSVSAVSSYESEAQIPPVEVLVSIATVLNVSLDYIAKVAPEGTFITEIERIRGGFEVELNNGRDYRLTAEGKSLSAYRMMMMNPRAGQGGQGGFPGGQPRAQR